MATVANNPVPRTPKESYAQLSDQVAAKTSPITVQVSKLGPRGNVNGLFQQQTPANIPASLINLSTSINASLEHLNAVIGLLALAEKTDPKPLVDGPDLASFPEQMEQALTTIATNGKILLDAIDNSIGHATEAGAETLRAVSSALSTGLDQLEAVVNKALISSD